MRNNELAITFESNYNMFFTAAFRVTGNVEDTEDAIQNSMIKAYLNLKAFRSESKLSTWIFRIILNEALNLSRDRKKLPTTKYAETHNMTENQVYDYINSFGLCDNNVINEKTRESCLQMFMNCMPGLLRVTYTLRIILEFSTAETAEILKISQNNVKTRLYRARKIIRDHFTGRCSLIKKDSMCNCRSYAKFLVLNDKADKLIRVDILRNDEKEAVLEFEDEIKKINEIDDFYRNSFCIDSDDNFKRRIINIIKSGELRILQNSDLKADKL